MCTRDLRIAKPIASRLLDSSTGHVLDFLVEADPEILYRMLADTKKTVYSMARHPAFEFDLDIEEETHLARAYTNGVRTHRAFLRLLTKAIDRHVQVARYFSTLHARVEAYSPVLNLTQSMIRASSLPLGQPLCHRNFHPLEPP